MTRPVDTKAETPVICSVRGEGIATLTINRPERRNALNLEVKRLIEQRVTALIDDASVRVIVLTGANGVFAAGTDVSEMVDMSATDHVTLATDSVFLRLRSCPKPLIAAVEGYALGGGMELALACDMVVAGKDAKFAQPEISLGIMPGAGGTQLLLRTVGKYRAMMLLLTGGRITAQQAYEWGLVSRLVDSGEALNAAVDLAGGIASMPPLSAAAIKDVVRQGQDMPLTGALALERRAFQILFDSEDQTEGMRAFLERRAPTFKGR